MGLRGPSKGTGGRPRKPLAEKITEGNPGRRPLKLIELPDPPELTAVDMPPVKEYMTETQRDGTELCAVEIYTETWEWLKGCGCERMVSPQLLRQYAMCCARWVQTEHALSRFSHISAHPTTREPMQSPFATLELAYMKQANQLWSTIYQIVRENCSVEYGGATPQDDVMERLLRSRER